MRRGIFVLLQSHEPKMTKLEKKPQEMQTKMKWCEYMQRVFESFHMRMVVGSVHKGLGNKGGVCA